jgi:hypothetical protein
MQLPRHWHENCRIRRERFPSSRLGFIDWSDALGLDVTLCIVLEYSSEVIENKVVRRGAAN